MTIVVKPVHTTVAMEEAPRLGVGIPVYNGARYLEQTLNSLLSQSYNDFVLVISDNGSTDATEDICRDYAACDARIEYHRHDENRGAAWNFNNVFRLTNTYYFKWSAADDLYAPTYLEECVRILDARPEVVLCYSRAKAVNENNDFTKTYPAQNRGANDSVIQRFAAAIINPHPFIPVFGIHRHSVLVKTSLIGSYSGSDRPLVGEVALHGQLYEVPEFLFYYRHHDDQSWGSSRSRHEQQAWYDPSRLNQLTFPTWRLMVEHEKTVWRSPLSMRQRIDCHVVMARWIRRRWRHLANNLILRDV